MTLIPFEIDFEKIKNQNEADDVHDGARKDVKPGQQRTADDTCNDGDIG